MCCSGTGGRIRIDNFSHWWGIWRREHGFDGLKFHELRHTQAMLLLANGVDVKTAQAGLGHTSASITLDWYAHAIPQNDHAAAAMLGSLLGGTGADGNDPQDLQEKRPIIPRKLVSVAPSRESFQSHGRRLEEGIRKQARSSKPLTCEFLGRGGRI